MKLSKNISYPAFNYQEYNICLQIKKDHAELLKEIHFAKTKNLKMALNSNLIDFIENLNSYENIMEKKDYQFIEKYFRENQNALPIDEIKSKFSSNDILIRIINDATFIQNLKGVSKKEKAKRIPQDKSKKDQDLGMKQIEITKNHQKEISERIVGKSSKSNNSNNNLLNSEESKNTQSRLFNDSPTKKEAKVSVKKIDDFFSKPQKIEKQSKKISDNNPLKNQVQIQPQETSKPIPVITQKNHDNIPRIDVPKSKELIKLKSIKHAYGNFEWGIIDQPESIYELKNHASSSEKTIFCDSPEVGFALIERIADSNYINIHIPNICSQFLTSSLDQKITDKRK